MKVSLLDDMDGKKSIQSSMNELMPKETIYYTLSENSEEEEVEPSIPSSSSIQDQILASYAMSGIYIYIE